MSTKKGKLRVVDGDRMYLGMPLDDSLPADQIHERLIEHSTEEIAEKLLLESPTGLASLPLPEQGAGTKVKPHHVLALLEDAVNMCCPDTDDEFDIGKDFKHKLLESHIGQIETFLDRPIIINLLNEGRLDLVREWFIDSTLNQPYYFGGQKGRPKLRKDLPRDSWSVE